MSMARLSRDQGKPQQAHELLAPVYDWFTEGFDTLDLKEAKALLEELAAPSRGRQIFSFRPNPKSLIGRSVVRTTVVRFADFTADELYTKQCDPFVVAKVELGGLRAGLSRGESQFSSFALLSD
jgi:hypothetical protein